MELHNHMETVVLDHIDMVLSKYPDCCKCDRCKQDIAIIALNNLPPMYTASQKGTIFRKIQAMSTELSIEVIEQIAKAVEIVKKEPRHDHAEP